MKYAIGDYTRLGGPGVAIVEWDGKALAQKFAISGLKEPTWCTPNKACNVIYSLGNNPADGEDTGALAAYERVGDELKLVSLHSTGGAAPCYITLSADERFVYVANYLGGNLAVFPVEGKGTDKRIQLVQHEGHGPNEKRQEHAHLHFCQFQPGTNKLFCVDLGIDAVMVYNQDPETGLLSFAERIDVPAGWGPRHLTFHGDSVIYLDYELGNMVSVLKKTDEGWKIVQSLSTLPPEGSPDRASTVAAIREFDGMVLVSNRGHNSLAVYGIQPDDTLALKGIYAVPGDFPRDFWVNADGTILVANQESGDVRMLQLTDTGLTQLGEALPLKGAVSVYPIAD